MLLVNIFRSSRVEEMYLYVEKDASFDVVPEDLRMRFGKPVKVMTLLLTPTKKLARVDAVEVIQALGNVGYFLQMPPPKPMWMHEQALEQEDRLADRLARRLSD